MWEGTFLLLINKIATFYIILAISSYLALKEEIFSLCWRGYLSSFGLWPI